MPRLIKIVVTPIIVVFLLFAMVWPFSPAGRQARNMKIGKTHIPIVESALHQVSKFKDFSAHPYTGGGGGIVITGVITEAGDENTLHEIISGLQIPVHVEYVLNNQVPLPTNPVETTTPPPEPY